MLELVIAVVVALAVGLLIGVTSMSRKVREAEHCRETVLTQFEEFMDTVYGDVKFQMFLIRYTAHWKQDTLDNATRKRLRRLGSQLLRIKDTDEDHPNSVERQ